MVDLAKQLDDIMERVRADFTSKNTARETALPLCRDAVRNSANAIRAVHRHEFDKARDLAGRARESLRVAKDSLREHPDIYNAGFVHDGQKEYAEAAITLAMVEGGDLPTPEQLDVEHAAYLNGMGEAIGELRRHLLDTLRAGDIAKCEQWLTAMDEMYGVMVTVDYPDAMTGGLRRTTDNVRGILERTRGDYTMSLQQRRLEQKLDAFNNKL
jgi:translin